MFWGLTMEEGKKYMQTVQESFHISQAVIDVNSVENSSNPVQVVLQYEEVHYILATLSKSAKIYQVPLDLNFQQGDKVAFRTIGPGRVHLSGYHVPDDDELASRLMMDEDSEGEEEEEEIETPSPPPGKRKKRSSDSVVAASKKTKIDATAEESSDEDEEDDSMMTSFVDSLSDLGDEEESDDEDDDEDDEDEDDDEEALPKPKKINGDATPSKKEQKKLNNSDKQKTPVALSKNQKDNNKTPKTPQDGPKTPKTPKEGKTPKQEAKTKQENKTPNTVPSSPSPKKRVLEGGIVAEELKVGEGPVAKTGKSVQVYYTGRLKSNNKQFDASTSGPGFRFKLGRGEVIKGWDIGVAGMKVGGKRRLTIPAGLAYGAKGSPPVIPPNSTLVFEVELRGTS